MNLFGPAHLVPLFEPLVNILLEGHTLLLSDFSEDDLAWKLAEFVYSGDLGGVEVV